MMRTLALFFLFALFGCNAQKVNRLVDKVGLNESIQNKYMSIRKKKATDFLKYQNGFDKLDTLGKVYYSIECNMPMESFDSLKTYPKKRQLEKLEYPVSTISNGSQSMKAIVRQSGETLEKTKKLLWNFVELQSKSDSINSLYNEEIFEYQDKLVKNSQYKIDVLKYDQCVNYKKLVEIEIIQAQAEVNAHRDHLMILYRPNFLKRFFKTERYRIYKKHGFPS
ncbi:hypothetical protein C943_01316 [Mariniradius saccharolyticus AK6]|uniref:Lipoprotein n=1 Tax=Mariniradius saccharolyticus AK6 TaxID=1239962 RepID=M7XCI8_9BACT|nr:hypothetical protein [Mariniradius saccharolyticus]EMS32589.1 hypothetical protein C943_01316 [Mariniradius saccharolyticus AK6]